MERGHLVGLSAKRELHLENRWLLSVLHTLADRMSALHQTVALSLLRNRTAPASQNVFLNLTGRGLR